MKKLTAVICILVLALAFTCVPVAQAEGESYAVPKGVSVTVSFRYGMGKPMSFTLPAGYTVVKMGEEDGYIRVRYGTLEDCFVTLGEFGKLVSATQARELPLIEVQLKGDSQQLFKMNERVNPEIVTGVDFGKKLYYLGDVEISSTAYYAVRQEGDSHHIYYAMKSSVANSAAVDSALDPDATVLEPTTPKADSGTKDNPYGWVRVVLILGIIVPLITIVFMIVRPKGMRRRAHREIYDSDDDYDGIDEI